MTTHVNGTAYGRAALGALRQVVSEVKRDDPLATVTVLAPSNVAAVTARRHLAHGLDDGRGAVAGLYVTTLPRLAEQLVAHRLHPRQPATGPVVASAWRRRLDEAPGAFTPVKDHTATVRALARAHRELRDLSPTGLDSARGAGSLAADLVRLHEEVTHDIQGKWYDATALLHAAADLCDTDPQAVKASGHVVLYLPQVLSAAETRFARSVAAQVPVTVIAGVTGVRRADHAVRQSLEGLGLDWPTHDVQPPVAQRVLHASDADDEVRCTVRQVVSALQQHPAHRVAILYGSAVPYARLLHEQLNAVGITVNGPSTRAVHERALARGFLGVLGLALQDLPRGPTFAALAEAPVRDGAGQRIPVATWERTSRTAAVVGGEDWGPRLERHLERERARLLREQAAEEPSESRIAAAGREIATTESLLAFVTTLRQHLHQGARLRGWGALSSWALELFADLYGEPEDLQRVPVEEQYAAVVLTSTLHGLGGLDEDEADLALLIEVLGLELEGALPRVGRFGDGVYVGPVSSAVGLELDAVFVLGLAEDAFPGQLPRDALLTDRVRAASGELRSMRDRLHDQRRGFLAALQSAPEVTVSFPRGDLRRSTERLPSRFLLPTLRDLTGNRELAATEWDDRSRYSAEAGDRLLASKSFAHSLQVQEPVTVQEWRTRARLVDALDDERTRAGEDLLAARESDAFTRFDGDLSHVEGLPDYRDGVQVVSPTALETYADCPHQFLLRRLLRVEPLQTPEEVVQISPADLGTLVHAVVDDLVSEAERDGTLPGPGEPWSEAHRCRIDEIAQVRADEAAADGLTGHPRLWRSDLARLRLDLQRLLDDDDAWRAERAAAVVRSELAFGLGRDERDQGPVEVPVSGGTVKFRGSADKVDRGSDGTLYVTDLKTGRSTKYAGLKDDVVAGGTRLQLPVYALAALRDLASGDIDQARAQYWFVRGGDRGKRIEVALDDTTTQLYSAALGRLVDGIAGGLFPGKVGKEPGFAYVECPWCTPDGIGHAEARGTYERKRSAPALRDLMTLIDPDAVPPDESGDSAEAGDPPGEGNA